MRRPSRAKDAPPAPNDGLCGRHDQTPADRLGRPPDVGPYARRGWDEEAACWRVVLTAEGTALAAKFLEEYPVPLLALRRHSRALFARLMREGSVRPDSQATSDALYGVAMAATTYRDGRGASFTTHAVWQIYGRVTRTRVRQFQLSKAMPARRLSGADAGRDPTPLDAAVRAEDEAAARRRAELALELAGPPAADVLERQFGLAAHPERRPGERAAAAGVRLHQVLYRERRALRVARLRCQGVRP